MWRVHKCCWKQWRRSGRQRTPPWRPPITLTVSDVCGCRCNHVEERVLKPSPTHNHSRRRQPHDHMHAQAWPAQLCEWRRRIQLAGGTSSRPAHLASRSGAAATTAALAVAQTVEVTCERLGTGGVGVCIWGDSRLVLLVRGALPGERLTAAITAVKRNYAEGVKVASLAPHRDAATPACQHYGAGCGGCSLQALSYAAQLAHKAEHVAQLLTRVGKFDAQTVQLARQPAVPAPASAQYGYRNKVQLAFSSKVWQQQQQQQGEGQQQQQQQQVVAVPGWGLGFLVPGSSDMVLPIQQCSLVPPEVNHAITRVGQLCQAAGLEPANSPSGAGVLRFLIIRTAAAAAADGAAGSTARDAAAAAAAQPAAPPPAPRALMAVLVTAPAATASQRQQLQALELVAAQLMASCPGMVTVVHSTEAAPAASRAGGAGAAGRRRGRRASRSNGGGSSSGGTGSDSDGSGGGRRGAQPLRVASSRVLAGPGHLVESLCGLQFRVSAHSFFQTNTGQAEQLFARVVQAVGAAAADGGSDSRPLLDLYCGTGTIALCLAAALPQHRVLGFDVSASSIADAAANSAANGIAEDRASFVCGDLDELLQAAGRDDEQQQQQQQQQQKRRAGPGRQDQPGGQQQQPLAGVTAGASQAPPLLSQLRPRAVVVDPARAGLGQGVVDNLLCCGAERVVYVSCNAATQARDLERLCAGGAFVLRSWTAVDMFPQTHVEHVEVVVVLERASA